MTQQSIVDAALKIGLDDANVRTVAAALGMSLPGLHYYVRTRDQLLDMVFETIFGQLVDDVSEEEGSFRNLLVRYARGFFKLLSQSPTAISMIYTGRAVVSSKGTKLLEQIIRSGVECGITAEKAYEIFRQISAAAAGAAAFEAADNATKNPATSIWKQFDVHMPQDDNTWQLRSVAPAPGESEDYDNFSSVMVTLNGLLQRAGIV